MQPILTPLKTPPPNQYGIWDISINWPTKNPKSPFLYILFSKLLWLLCFFYEQPCISQSRFNYFGIFCDICKTYYCPEGNEMMIDILSSWFYETVNNFSHFMSRTRLWFCKNEFNGVGNYASTLHKGTWTIKLIVSASSESGNHKQISTVAVSEVF